MSMFHWVSSCLCMPCLEMFMSVHSKSCVCVCVCVCLVCVCVCVCECECVRVRVRVCVSAGRLVLSFLPAMPRTTQPTEDFSTLCASVCVCVCECMCRSESVCDLK